MKMKKWLENWDLTKLKLTVGFLETEWEPQEKDREAAWELYVELVTRTVTQPLPAGYGDERSALASAHSLFSITREILRRKGRDCVQFSKLAVVVLNQIIRPFTAKWHGLAERRMLDSEEERRAFRSDLHVLQADLQLYSRALADIAEVEDLTNAIESRGTTNG